MVRIGGDEMESQLCELLGDLLTRARAGETIRATVSANGRENAPVTSVLAVRVPAGEGTVPAREFRLIPFGNVGVDRPIAGGQFEFTRAHAEAAQRWFETIGRKLAIDYEHQSIDRLNTRPDGLRPAAGWIGGLEVRDDGLWAVEVEWTPRAQELLKSGEYKYFSPVIFWADAERSELASLGPVALTNDPAMHGVAALAAGRSRVSDDADSADQHDSNGATEVAALQEEISVLKGEIARQEADAFVEQGLRLGKIVEATSMDWRDDYLRDPEGTSARLARAPVVLPPGRVLAHSRAARGAGRVNERLARLGIDAADLDAYERALAGGRVRGLSTIE